MFNFTDNEKIKYILQKEKCPNCNSEEIMYIPQTKNTFKCMKCNCEFEKDLDNIIIDNENYIYQMHKILYLETEKIAKNEFTLADYIIKYHNRSNRKGRIILDCYFIDKNLVFENTHLDYENFKKIINNKQYEIIEKNNLLFFYKEGEDRPYGGIYPLPGINKEYFLDKKQ